MLEDQEMEGLASMASVAGLDKTKILAASEDAEFLSTQASPDKAPSESSRIDGQGRTNTPTLSHIRADARHAVREACLHPRHHISTIAVRLVCAPVDDAEEIRTGGRDTQRRALAVTAAAGSGRDRRDKATAG